ncbi:MAG: cation-translocating P-type ATPase [Burkholderiales bacterium]
MRAAVSAASVLDDEIEYARFTRPLVAERGPRSAESSLRIGGMHCVACASTIEHALRRVDGVIDARVSAAAQCATVQWQVERTRPSAFVRAIERAGYTAAPDTAAGARALRRKESRDALWRLFVAGFCAMQVMMLATPSYVSSARELAPDLKQLLDWGSWLLTLPVMLFAAAPFFTGAWRSLRSGRIGMDVPAALGMLVAFVASSGAAFDPGGVFGQEVYFDSLTMFVGFLLGGRYLEMRARHRAALALEDAIGRLPETASRENADGSVASISVLRLQRGDVVRVPVGQAFCADGVLTRGRTRADESLLSGESAPVEKGVGDTLVAGSMNLGAPVAMRVERVGADTRYEAIVAMMRDARNRRPATPQSSDRWAAPFLWAVLVLAAGAAAVWSVIDPGRAVWVAVSVLIVTCPCALSLAAPSALLSAAAAMARRGVLLRRIEAIEGLARMRTLFLDKTGTLTEARSQGVQMVRIDHGPRRSDAMLRATAASLAAWSTHPLAQALARENEGCGTAWRELVETPGQGMQGRAPDGSVWRLGKSPAVQAAANEGDEVETWLSCDGRPVACFRFAEVLRPDAVAALRALERDGVRIALLSGDTPTRVERIGRLLGLADRRGGMTPQDKLAAVREAQARGELVAMLGDGINDAPVLAQADTSLAMGEGAQIARAQADGVLASNSLADVVRARALAKKTLRVVRQNFVWAATYNAACVPLALIGWLPPWAAGLGMATSSLVVVLNSLRLAR